MSAFGRRTVELQLLGPAVLFIAVLFIAEVHAVLLCFGLCLGLGFSPWDSHARTGHEMGGGEVHLASWTGLGTIFTGLTLFISH